MTTTLINAHQNKLTIVNQNACKRQPLGYKLSAYLCVCFAANDICLSLVCSSQLIASNPMLSNAANKKDIQPKVARSSSQSS